MAQLREVPYVLKTVGIWPFAKRILREVNDDGVLNMAAAVAFYWLLAIFPLMIFFASLAAILPHEIKDVLFARITDWIYANFAKEAADTIWKNVEDVFQHPRGGLLSLGLLLTLWAASNGVNATMGALDRCYDITKPRPFLKQRGVAILMTVAVVLIILAVGLLIPVSSALLKYIRTSSDYVPSWARGGTAALIDVARYTVGVLLVILLVSSIYQFGVSLRRRWTLITPGAVFAVFGVMAMAYAFNWYIQSFGAESYTKTYKGLGGVIILLLLFYLYAVVFLIGAEINSEIDYEVLGAKNDEGTDPLPHLHRAKELERFKKQLEARQEKR